MLPLFRDTDPASERVLVEGLRRMAGAEKLARVFALREAALSLAAARMTEEGRSEREIRLTLASAWVPADVMRRVFGWDPDHRRDKALGVE